MQEIFSALNLDHASAQFTLVDKENFPGCFHVSELAAASFAAVACSTAALVKDLGFVASQPSVQVNQRLASLWFTLCIQPIDWEMPPVWDSIAGLYQTRDGWIRLHTNLQHHRQAALTVLQVEASREKVAAAVKSFSGNELETAIVDAGGVAAFMRSQEEWSNHPQGVAVAAEPLIAWSEYHKASIKIWSATQAKPLQGLKVLDLTRVLAGPVATRTLAGFGADVLRIDPPGWNEANVVPDITLGKRCAFLDLKQAESCETFKHLLANADVLVHGYRPDALELLGLGEKERRKISPNLIEVSLDAYGWTGPWAKRRGFDSLVQMSSGIAHAGMLWAKSEQPTPLPVQALDFATGYMMAASVIRALSSAVNGKGINSARLSLARTAKLLTEHMQTGKGLLEKNYESKDIADNIEHTPWGKAQRLKSAITIQGTSVQWPRPACELGSSVAEWLI